ncbi:AsnC family protein [Brevibacterium antiquum]|uniref:AsnC family protein n=1 Tax=Brevibacterium antiquum TaxID=234835 RepID=UPI002D794A36|nr:AsnC family protein [Brevibacterium antiquum]
MCTTRMERTLCSFGFTRIKIAPRAQLPQTVDMDTALDAIDLEILDILQHDTRLPQAALGARVGLSTAEFFKSSGTRVSEAVVRLPLFRCPPLVG